MATASPLVFGELLWALRTSEVKPVMPGKVLAARIGHRPKHQTKTKVREVNWAFLDLGFSKSDNFCFILTAAHPPERGVGRRAERSMGAEKRTPMVRTRNNLPGCSDVGFSITSCCLILVVFGKREDRDFFFLF